ncbi:hypothetical protein H0H81_003361 [Sphagnurus paluster]|uniref:Non-haem dioxygenase N-terminal domain-containing protein n=1 Tax=Sphagnurus paluster TaxID=117069 RepID=A0A9P7GLH7_9AGAR|nr:hypothetical protein H0H81_003361 [Sphagnurus paluster]
MPAVTLPAFPDNVPTHLLLVIDYDLLKARDEAEIDRLWEAATKLGFWYLKNHGVTTEVDNMFYMGKETMALPIEEKLRFEQGDEGSSFGWVFTSNVPNVHANQYISRYKAAGANAVDATGKLDTVEFINVAKDDALAWPKQAHRTYPSTVNAHMEPTIIPFIRKSLDINNTLLDILNDRLGLPKGTLLEKHRMEEYSGSESRVIRNPPQHQQPGKPPTVAIGSHTDFGSLSFLHNRLGGLQVLVPGAETWQYVKVRRPASLRPLSQQIISTS